jgi:cell wall hydrolase sleB
MFEKYTIQNGESLASIAKKFDTDVNMLLDINNISYEDMLRAGSEIIVPKSKEKYFEYYTIEKGDNLYRIALKYNINPELLSNLNGLMMDDYIYPGQELLIPKSGYSYYITTEGDTLDIVANRFKVSKNKIMTENETIYLMPDQLLVNKNS